MAEFIQENSGNLIVGLIVLAIVGFAVYRVFFHVDPDDACAVAKNTGSCGNCKKCG